MTSSPSFLIIATICVSGFVVLLAIILIWRHRFAPWNRSTPPPFTPPVAPAPPGEKPPLYTYKDFARDLTDEKIEISDILERCKGALPPESEPVRVGPAGQDGTAPQGVPGGPPPMGLDGGPAARVSERLPVAADRQAWFAQLAQQLPKLKIIPPPVPQVVVTVPGMKIKCSCKSGISTMPDRFSNPNQGPFRPDAPHRQDGIYRVNTPKCEKCNDTGFVVMTVDK